jgi:hypothetical protein
MVKRGAPRVVRQRLRDDALSPRVARGIFACARRVPCERVSAIQERFVAVKGDLLCTACGYPGCKCVKCQRGDKGGKHQCWLSSRGVGKQSRSCIYVAANRSECIRHGVSSCESTPGARSINTFGRPCLFSKRECRLASLCSDVDVGAPSAQTAQFQFCIRLPFATMKQELDQRDRGAVRRQVGGMGWLWYPGLLAPYTTAYCMILATGRALGLPRSRADR